MRNPYVTDRPLTDRDSFYGRHAQFKQLKAFLADRRQLVLLYGKPHIGKTSFINQLALRMGHHYRVYSVGWAQLGDPGTRPNRRLLRGLAQALDLGDDNDYAALNTLQEAVQRMWHDAAAASDPTSLICLDGIPCKELAPDARYVDEWKVALQELDQAAREIEGLALLLSIKGRAEQCALKDLELPEITLEGLSMDETEQLLISPARPALIFDYQSARQVYRLTGGEPLLIQTFARVLFDRRASFGWAGKSEVDQAVEEVIEEAEATFREEWQRSDDLERITLCVFADRIGSHGMGSARDISLHLRHLYVNVPEKDIEEALHKLRRRNIVETLGGGTYRFRNTLFLNWLKRNKDTLETVRQASNYQRGKPAPAYAEQSEGTDWVALLLWTVAALLIVLIIYIWRNRERQIVWTGTSPTPTAESGAAKQATVPLPTPQRGVAPGHIVYMAKSGQDAYWNIYRMRSDGSDPVQLTSEAANDTMPVWSPDGRDVAFVSDRDGNREIYVMQADGSQPVNLTLHNAQDWTPSWSPDGQQIAFASFRDENWELYLMDADGTNQQRLTQHSAADYGPTWSPQGDRLAFVSDRNGNLDIHLLDLESGSVTSFTNDEATDQSPSWSPDGSQILWESYRDGNMEIYASAVDKLEPRNLSKDSYADDHGASWSPWGDSIAFFSNRDQGWDIFTLDLQSGQRNNVTMSDVLEQSPAWGR